VPVVVGLCLYFDSKVLKNARQEKNKKKLTFNQLSRSADTTVRFPSLLLSMSILH